MSWSSLRQRLFLCIYDALMHGHWLNSNEHHGGSSRSVAAYSFAGVHRAQVLSDGQFPTVFNKIG